PLPDDVLEALRGVPDGFGSLASYKVEIDREFVARVEGDPPQRIRLIAARADAMAVAFDGNPEIALYGNEVTESGRVEILPFVKEQSVSVTAHRFGAPDPRFANLSI
ncbi:MAG TPA: hypothetical protein DCE05_05030, partial [Microbacteriaceae bacterium]|nr:hypothetical protein [Microbacteriaceae bacterium]